MNICRFYRDTIHFLSNDPIYFLVCVQVTITNMVVVDMVAAVAVSAATLVALVETLVAPLAQTGGEAPTRALCCAHPLARAADMAVYRALLAADYNACILRGIIHAYSRRAQGGVRAIYIVVNI